MARTPAGFPGGVRISDYLTVNVIAQVYPHDTVREALRLTDSNSLRRRDLPAEVMVYYVIVMAFFRAVSAREVLRCLVDGLRLSAPGLALKVSGKSSISRARGRLGLQPLAALRSACVAPLAGPDTRGAWYRGLRLVAFDGSTLNLPDEAGNRDTFGLPGGSRGDAAFPQLRVTTMVEVGTRAAFAWHAGPLSESEAEQAERLLPELGSGMLVLADRYYGGYPLWLRAQATGAELLWRFKSNMKFPVEEKYADGSWRSVIRGSGRDRRKSRGTLPVRVVTYRLEPEDAVYTLVTTLLDPETAPAAELAALYHERWEIETACDEIKTHLLGPGTLLRSKTPELVYQEVDGLLLAHYAVRSLVHRAAVRAGEDPDRLSFVHAVRAMRRRITQPGGFPPTGADGRADRGDP